ncbi:hypothetical protein MMC08_003926 [Hypocenomyce scalaris]|nr:hypothetical protein [Hypocenomyce scalaris]
MENQDDYVGRTLTDLEIAEEIIGILYEPYSDRLLDSRLADTVKICWIRDPVVYRKLKEELNTELKDWPGAGSSVPDLSRLQGLTYTNAVISEGLRRYPTIPGTMPRTVTSSSITLGGFRLPRNTIVGAQNFSIHLSEDYFPDPEKFDPDRFLGDSQKKAREALNPFSEGPRGCIGRNLAMLEMQIVVPMFFKYFDAELDQSMTAEDMRLKDAFSGCPAGQRVLLKLRKSNV